MSIWVFFRNCQNHLVWQQGLTRGVCRWCRVSNTRRYQNITVDPWWSTGSINNRQTKPRQHCKQTVGCRAELPMHWCRPPCPPRRRRLVILPLTVPRAHFFCSNLLSLAPSMDLVEMDWAMGTGIRHDLWPTSNNLGPSGRIHEVWFYQLPLPPLPTNMKVSLKWITCFCQISQALLLVFPTISMASTWSAHLVSGPTGASRNAKDQPAQAAAYSSFIVQMTVEPDFDSP